MNDLIFSSAFVVYLIVLAAGCSTLILYGVEFLKTSILPPSWTGDKKTLLWVGLVTLLYTVAAWSLNLFDPIYERFAEYNHITILIWFFIITFGTACGINNRQKKNALLRS